jgi:uncharacterized protein (DUF2252 family)
MASKVSRLSSDSRGDRRAKGKAAREKVPRSRNGEWEAGPGRADPVDILEAQAGDRDRSLVPIRYGRMLESPFAFYRGAAAVMAADLAKTPVSGITAQLCGDAHLSNFGGFASPDRTMVFDCNDFDETLPGPWEWDVKRLGASLSIALRSIGASSKERKTAVRRMARVYRQSVRDFAEMTNLDVWYARLDQAQVWERWGDRASPKRRARAEKRMAKARSKDHTRALERLTTRVSGQLRIASAPPLISPIEEWVPDGEMAATEERMAAILRAYRRTLPGSARALLDGYRYVHMARKAVGVGSVGTRALIVLMVGADERDPLFLQVKEAQASVLEAHLRKSRFRAHGQRVVEGQWLMQAASDVLLGWLSAEGVDGVKRDFYVRQLWDWKISAEVDAMTPGDLGIYGEVCAWTLARAHARSGDRIALASYLGAGDSFDRALARFSEAYADQNDADYAGLADAVKSGLVAAETSV